MKLIVMLLVVGVTFSVVARAEEKAAGASDPVAAGKALVEKNKCSICHVIDGKGGKMGKAMDTYADKSEQELIDGIMDPKKALGPTTKMPSYKGKLTDDEVKSVAAYIKSLKK